MLTVLSLLDTRAGLNDANTTLTLPELTHRVNRGKMLNLQDVTQQPSHRNGKILLYMHFGTLYARVWFAILPNLAVARLFGTPFINRFISGNYLFENVLRYFHSVAIWVVFKTYKPHIPTAAFVDVSIGKIRKTGNEVEERAAPICVMRQALLQTQNECCVMTTTPSFGIRISERRAQHTRTNLSADNCHP